MNMLRFSVRTRNSLKTRKLCRLARDGSYTVGRDGNNVSPCSSATASTMHCGLTSCKAEYSLSLDLQGIHGKNKFRRRATVHVKRELCLSTPWRLKDKPVPTSFSKHVSRLAHVCPGFSLREHGRMKTCPLQSFIAKATC